MVKNPINTTRHCRPAIAMIELIFAIVIMGIVMMSAPMLIATSSKSGYAAMQQEAISTTASQIQTIMSTMWDEQDTDGSVGVPLLQTGASSCTTDTPPGTTSQSGRYCKDALATNSRTFSASLPLGHETSDGDIYDDIDDYDTNGTLLSEVNETTTTPDGDYIDTQITITSAVIYADGAFGSTTNSNPFDTLAAGTTDVKLISVVTTSSTSVSELGKNIRMSAFMCNIGAPKEILSNEGAL